MDLSIKKAAGRTDCRIHFNGLGEGAWKLVLTEQSQSRILPLQNDWAVFSTVGPTAVHGRLVK
jgi:hypothetical protein